MVQVYCKLCLQGLLYTQWKFHTAQKQHLQHLPFKIVIKGPLLRDKVDELYAYFINFGGIRSQDVIQDGDKISVEYRFWDARVHSEIIHQEHRIGDQELEISWYKKNALGTLEYVKENERMRQEKFVYRKLALLSELKSLSTFSEQLTLLQNKLEIVQKEMKINRQKIYTDLTSAISSNFRHSKIHFFGSAITELFLHDSDLNIYIDNTDGEKSTLELLSDLIKTCENFLDVTLADSRIKCRHKQTQVSCKIDVKSELPVGNSELVKYYLTLNEKLKFFTLLVKFWADCHGFREIYGGYALSLMVIFYLQRAFQLPLVHDLQKDLPVDEVDGWNCAFGPVEFSSSVLENTTMVELLSGFFTFYANFDYEHQIVTPFFGPVDEKNKFAGFYVQDPFEHSRNVAPVTLSTSGKFTAACRQSLKVLPSNMFDLFMFSHDAKIYLRKDKGRDEDWICALLALTEKNLKDVCSEVEDSFIPTEIVYCCKGCCKFLDDKDAVMKVTLKFETPLGVTIYFEKEGDCDILFHVIHFFHTNVIKLLKDRSFVERMEKSPKVVEKAAKILQENKVKTEVDCSIELLSSDDEVEEISSKVEEVPEELKTDVDLTVERPSSIECENIADLETTHEDKTTTEEIVDFRNAIVEAATLSDQTAILSKIPRVGKLSDCGTITTDLVSIFPDSKIELIDSLMYPPTYEIFINLKENDLELIHERLFKHPQFADILPGDSSVKCRHVGTDSFCVLNFTKPLLSTTNLLKYYLNGDNVQLLTVFVELWASHFFDAFNSYSLYLMVIFSLQQEPFNFPSVAQLQDETPVTSRTYSLLELVEHFFSFYSTFDYTKYAICTYCGSAVEKVSFLEPYNNLPEAYRPYIQGKKKFQTHPGICIQDPFGHWSNVSASVSPETSGNFSALCRMAAGLKVSNLSPYLNLEVHKCNSFVIKKKEGASRETVQGHMLYILTKILGCVVTESQTGYDCKVPVGIWDKTLKQSNKDEDSKEMVWDCIKVNLVVEDIVQVTVHGDNGGLHLLQAIYTKMLNLGCSEDTGENELGSVATSHQPDQSQKVTVKTEETSTTFEDFKNNLFTKINSGATFDDQISILITTLDLLKPQIEAKSAAVCKDLQSTLSSISPQITIFGSTVSNLITYKTCLDIFIDTQTSTIEKIAPIRTKLDQSKKFTQIDYNSRVLKCTHVETELCCYIHISDKNRLVSGTELARNFVNLHEKVRKIMLFLRFWVDCTDLAILPKHILDLLVIFYLQQEPYKLPPLNDLQKTTDLSVLECTSIFTLIEDFFKFYGNFDYFTYIISPNSGCLVEKGRHLLEITQPWLTMEDPVAASGIISTNLQRNFGIIVSKFRKALCVMYGKNRKKNLVHALLTRSYMNTSQFQIIHDSNLDEKTWQSEVLQVFLQITKELLGSTVKEVKCQKRGLIHRISHYKPSHDENALQKVIDLPESASEWEKDKVLIPYVLGKGHAHVQAVRVSFLQKPTRIVFVFEEANWFYYQYLHIIYTRMMKFLPNRSDDGMQVLSRDAEVDQNSKTESEDQTLVELSHQEIKNKPSQDSVESKIEKMEEISEASPLEATTECVSDIADQLEELLTKVINKLETDSIKNNQEILEMVKSEDIQDTASATFAEQASNFFRDFQSAASSQKTILEAVEADLVSVFENKVKHYQFFGSITSGLDTETTCIHVYVELDGLLGSSEFFQKLDALLISPPCKFIYTSTSGGPKYMFTHIKTQTSVIVYCKDDFGIHNTRLIRYYLNLDEKVLTSMVIIKSWVDRQEGLKQFSIYILANMMIFYLQQMYKLPSVVHLQSRTAAHMLDGWNCAFETIEFNMKDTTTLEILKGFFKYYGDFDYFSFVITLFFGSPIAKTRFLFPYTLPEVYEPYIKKHCQLSVDQGMCIQAPFVHSNNASSFVTYQIASTFAGCCRHATKILQQSEEGLLEKLLTPQLPRVSEFTITRPEGENVEDWSGTITNLLRKILKQVFGGTSPPNTLTKFQYHYSFPSHILHGRIKVLKNVLKQLHRSTSLIDKEIAVTSNMKQNIKINLWSEVTVTEDFDNDKVVMKLPGNYMDHACHFLYTRLMKFLNCKFSRATVVSDDAPLPSKKIKLDFPSNESVEEEKGARVSVVPGLTPAPNKNSKQTILNNTRNILNFTTQVSQFCQMLVDPQTVERYRQLVHDDLHSVLSTRFTFDKIHFFGSSVTGLFTSDSDFNMYVDNLKKNTQETMMEALKLALSDGNKFSVTCTSSAALVKFKHNGSGTECCLHFLSRLAVCNTLLLQYYLTLDPKVRQFLFLMKSWSESCDKKESQLTKHVLYLMVIFYLQQPPYNFPSVADLQRNAPDDIIDGWNGAFTPMEFESKPLKTVTIKNLIVGFFSFYANFDYFSYVIAPFFGFAIEKMRFCRPIDLPPCYQRAKKDKFVFVDLSIFVQDPFEHCRNTATEVTHQGVARFAASCRNVLEVFKSTEKGLLYRWMSQCRNDSFMRTFEIAKGPELEPGQWFLKVKNAVLIILTKILCCKVIDVNEKKKGGDIDQIVINCMGLRNMWDHRIDILKAGRKELAPEASQLDKDIFVSKVIMNDQKRISNWCFNVELKFVKNPVFVRVSMQVKKKPHLMHFFYTRVLMALESDVTEVEACGTSIPCKQLNIARSTISQPYKILVTGSFGSEDILNLHSYFLNFGKITILKIVGEDRKLAVEYSFEALSVYLSIIQKEHSCYGRPLKIIPLAPLKDNISYAKFEDPKLAAIHEVVPHATFNEQLNALWDHFNNYTVKLNMKSHRKIIHDDLNSVLDVKFTKTAANFEPNTVDVTFEFDNYDFLIDNVVPERFSDLKDLISKSEKFQDVVQFSDVISCVHVKTLTCCYLRLNTGVENATNKLLKYYLSLDSKLQTFVMMIKFWLNYHSFVGADSFSNRAVLLLVIFYLQQEPYCLPSLRKLQEGATSEEVEGCHIAYAEIVDFSSTNLEQATILELVTGFLRFYAKFDHISYVISPYLGSAVPKTSFLLSSTPSGCPKLDVSSGICIQDFLKHNVNISQISSDTAGSFTNLCRRSLELMQSNEKLLLHKLLLESHSCLYDYPEFVIDKKDSQDQKEWAESVTTIMVKILTEVMSYKLSLIPVFNSEQYSYGCVGQYNVWARRLETEKLLALKSRGIDDEVAITKEVIRLFPEEVEWKLFVDLVFMKDPSRVKVVFVKKPGCCNVFHICHFLYTRMVRFLDGETEEVKVEEMKDCETGNMEDAIDLPEESSSVQHAVEEEAKVTTSGEKEDLEQPEMCEISEKVQEKEAETKDLQEEGNSLCTTSRDLERSKEEETKTKSLSEAGSSPSTTSSLKRQRSEEEEDDIPSDFFDDFSNEDFLNGFEWEQDSPQGTPKKESVKKGTPAKKTREKFPVTRRRRSRSRPRDRREDRFARKRRRSTDIDRSPSKPSKPREGRKCRRSRSRSKPRYRLPKAKRRSGDRSCSSSSTDSSRKEKLLEEIKAKLNEVKPVCSNCPVVPLKRRSIDRSCSSSSSDSSRKEKLLEEIKAKLNEVKPVCSTYPVLPPQIFPPSLPPFVAVPNYTDFLMATPLVSNQVQVVPTFPGELKQVNIEKTNLSAFLTNPQQAQQLQTFANAQRKVKLLARAYDIINIMSENSKFALKPRPIPNPRKLYQSPLKKTSIVRFSFTSPSKHASEDPFLELLNKILQRIGTMINFQEQPLEDLAESVEKAIRKRSSRNKETVKSILEKTFLGVTRENQIEKIDATTQCGVVTNDMEIQVMRKKNKRDLS